MHEGYGSHSVYVCVCVCVCVYLSVTAKSATYLVCTSKLQCHRVLYGVFKVFVVSLSPKMLCSKVLTSFAEHNCLSRFLMSSPWTKETTMASFQQD